MMRAPTKKDVLKFLVAHGVALCSEHVAKKVLMTALDDPKGFAKIIAIVGCFGIGAVVGSAVYKEIDETMELIEKIVIIMNETGGAVRASKGA